MLNDAAAAQPDDGQPGLARSPDTLVRTMSGHITAWSPGMQQRYGFTSEQAYGHISHRLLETTFPRPLQAIETVLMQRHTWTGALIHRHADRRPILAVNHWYMHRDDDAHLPLVTEVHSDISQTRDGMQGDLAEVLATLAQEFGDTLRALKSCVDGAYLSLQADAPDLKGLHSEMLRASAQITRGTEGVRLLRALVDSKRDTG